MTNDESQNGSVVSDEKPPTPPVAFCLYDHLEFIDILDDKSSNSYLLLGASNLVKKDWTGGIWYYDNPEMAPQPENASASLSTYSANSAGQLIDYDKCIFGDDEGIINIYKVNEEHKFQMEHSKELCHSYISSLSVSPSKSKTIVAFSQNLTLFENETFLTSKTFGGAHVKKITCVHWGPQEDTFVSTSIDKSAILWDLRQSKPALAIYEDENSFLKSASWLNSNEVAIGTLSGEILSVDIRSQSTLYSVHSHKKPVHKLQFNSNTCALAACYDSNHVTVIDNKFDVIYNNESHKSMVRGLAWHPTSGQLFSCGYGAQIVRHELPKL